MNASQGFTYAGIHTAGSHSPLKSFPRNHNTGELTR